MLRIRSFIASVTGNVALLAAIIIPVLLGMGALAVDYALVYNQQSHLQDAADAAVLAAARELGIGLTRI